MTKWIVSTPLKGTNLMKNFVCFTEVELQKLLEQYPEAIVEMKDSHLEDHAPLPLNDDQQVVLEWFKEETQKRDDCPFAVIHRFFTEKLHKRLPKNIYFSYLGLSDEQQYQVLAAFAEWGISMENAKEKMEAYLENLSKMGTKEVESLKEEYQNFSNDYQEEGRKE